MTQCDRDQLLDEVLNSIICLEWGFEKGLLRPALYESIKNSLYSMKLILMRSSTEKK
jgi:hypothetical protein